MNDVLLRALKPEDCELLFSWRNDPWIVSLSASQRTVDIMEHRAWFADVLAREDMLIRIISNGLGQDMGLVRVARDNQTDATITVYLMQAFIGKKRGPEAIRQACAIAFEEWPDLQNVDACIRSENVRSIAAFSRIGFRAQTKTTYMSGDDMIRMHLQRSAFK